MAGVKASLVTNSVLPHNRVASQNCRASLPQNLHDPRDDGVDLGLLQVAETGGRDASRLSTGSARPSISEVRGVDGSQATLPPFPAVSAA
jgi:hypothetical protein